MILKKGVMKNIALVVLVAFIFSLGLPVNQVMAAEQITQPAGDEKNRVAEVRGKKHNNGLGNLVPKLKNHYAEIDASLDKKDIKQLRGEIKETQTALKEARKEITHRLDINAAELKKLNAAKALKRHQKFKKNLQQKINDTEQHLARLDEMSAAVQELKGSSVDRIREELNEVKNMMSPERPGSPLGSNLPHRDTDVQATSLPETTAEGSESSLPPVPVEEDLAETGATEVTPGIERLAGLLSDSPLEIYQYVRNNIYFEPYYGIRKGAAGTLREESGNAFDQAALLISLLRYKDIPARYVRGTVEVPADKLMNWVNASTPEAAVKTLRAPGIPVSPVVSGGEITGARFEHVWVEAYVPYDNYRGAPPETGEKVWVPLDPSFKQHKLKPGIDLEEISGINMQAVTDGVRDAGEVSSGGLAVTAMDLEEVKSQLLAGVDNIEDYLAENNMEEAGIKDITGGLEIIPEYRGILPLSLPYKKASEISKYAGMPSSLTGELKFELLGADPFGLNFSGDSHFSHAVGAAELYGKRITLSWVPATEEDQNVINHYGGVFNTPAYMVEVRPRLKIGGNTVAEGKPVGLAYRQQFAITFNMPNIPEDRVENPVTAGGFYSVGLNYGRVSQIELRNIADHIRGVQSTLNGENIFADDKIGEILNGIGKAYFAQQDMANQLAAEELGINATRMLSEAVTGYEPRVKYLFMSPVEINHGGMYIDVDRDVVSAVSRTNSEEKKRAYMMVSGVLGSALEHSIYEETTGIPSVSAVKLLEQANEAGIPLYTVTGRNMDRILPELEASHSVKNDIRNAVNSGRIVTIPQSRLAPGDWEGTGYIVLDPETGAAGYMISGGVAGGATSEVIAPAVLANIALAIADIVEASLLLSCTGLAGPGGLIAVAFLALAGYQAVTLFNEMYSYYVEGDEGAAEALVTSAVIGLVSFGALSALTGLVMKIRKLKTLCFAAGTAVLTAGGYKDIEDIEAGDRVYALNPETGEKGLEKVKQVSVNETGKLVNVRAGDVELKVTPNHPMLAAGKGWVAAGALRRGDQLLRYSGKSVEVEEVAPEQAGDPLKVYNLEVEGLHTYFVSRYNILVHNDCPPDFKTGRPVNRVGMVYLSVIDLRTGKEIPFPDGELKVIPEKQRVGWFIDKNYANKMRKQYPDRYQEGEILCKGEFIDEWYRRGYPDPPQDWKQYEIHHIKPRSLGGDNSFENLVPVEKTIHPYFNRFWNNW